MDDPALDAGLHEEALAQLRRIFWLSRTAQPVWDILERFSREKNLMPLRGIDIGTGGGDLPLAITQKANLCKIPLTLDGADISATALNCASQNAQRKKLSVRFIKFDIKSGGIPAHYDFLVSSLFLHHLTPEEIGSFFKILQTSNLKLAIFTDLLRSIPGWLLAHLTTWTLTPSPVVKKDALLSVKAAYTLDEICEIARESGLSKIELKKIWPERFLLVWKR